LRRADTEVVEEPAQPSVMTEVGEDRGQLVESSPTEVNSGAIGRQPLSGGRDRQLVLIDADEVKVRMSLEQGGGMSTTADGGIEKRSGWNSFGEGDHLVDHHRLVVESVDRRGRSRLRWF